MSTHNAAVVLKLPEFQRELTVDEKLVAARGAALATAQAITAVASQQDYEAATAALNGVTKLDAAIEKNRKKLAEPFLEAQRFIKAKIDEFCDPLQTEKARLKKLTGDWYMAEQKRLADLRAEQDRKDQEAAAAAFAKQQADAEAAAELGFDAPPPVEIVVTEQAAVPMAPVSDSAKVTMRVDVELMDLDKVPRAFLCLDDRAVNAYKRDNKADILRRVAAGESDNIVPGLRFTARPDVSGR